jgi:DnaJ-class molecular chaperone
MAFGRNKVDPHIATQIEQDIAEIDGTKPKPEAKPRDTGKSAPCPDCTGGLTEDRQLCPTCGGNGSISA